MFKANDTVSKRFVKIYIGWYAKMLKFFAEKKKMWVAFAVATHIFSANQIRILDIDSAKTVNEMTYNELVKLTTFWTTGPSIFNPSNPFWKEVYSQRKEWAHKSNKFNCPVYVTHQLSVCLENICVEYRILRSNAFPDVAAQIMIFDETQMLK